MQTLPLGLAVRTAALSLFGAQATGVEQGSLVHFTQASYATAADADGFAARGWLYVSAACSGDGAADAGRVVVLFPQAEPSFQPLNPNGCWDWWGYGGAEYATQAGPQIAAVKAMVDDLMGSGEPARTGP